MTSSARPPRRSPSPWLVGALVAGAAAWARHRGSLPWPEAAAPALGTSRPIQPIQPPAAVAPAPVVVNEQLQQELRHLVKIRLPAALAGTEVPPADRPQELSPETAALLEELLVQVSTTVSEREESRRLAMVELAGRVQTSAHRIQQAMSGLAERHPGDPDLLETTMRVDHAATQQARHAQSVKVLCDEWPGQQWPAPLALVDVVRAASGRIVAFSRVQVTGDQTVAVVPTVVEPLIHLIAELLANATEYSAPTTPVTVAVRGVQRGAVIELDDSGFGLDEYRLTEAREIVSGRRLLGLNDVGEIPQTGFAVVGRFARRHGFTVDLGISPYGGVRAIILVPTELIETVALPAPAVLSEPVVRDTRSVEVAEPTVAAPAVKTDSEPESALPQRRSARRRDQATPFRTDPGGLPRPVPTTAPATAPEAAGDWMERFFEGSQPIPVTKETDLDRKDAAQG